MLIGLDAIPLTEAKTGVGHYTFELARALAVAAPGEEFELAYPSIYPPINLDDNDVNEAVWPSNLRAARVETGSLDRHWWSIGLPRHLRKNRHELFHGTNFEVPVWGGRPTVLTIHDLSAYLYPETQVARRMRRTRRRLPLMARIASMIITPTESVRREVCLHLKVNPAKVVAVPEAPRPIFQPLPPAESLAVNWRLGVTGNFLLAVGTLEPRKNLITLIRAFEELVNFSDPAKDISLILAGKTGWLTEELFAHVAASNVRDRIHFTGYVTDTELRALYSTCMAFIYPSLYEGFGLPPLEAMSCGAPVIAGRIPALLETLGDEAAILLPPTDTQALARSLDELLNNQEMRRRHSLAGQRCAAKFTWERTAQMTHDIYEQVLGTAKG